MRNSAAVNLVVWAIVVVFVTVASAADPKSPDTQERLTTGGSFRERSLDHWDAEALSYYLGVDSNTGEPLEQHDYPGHDAAVMFYAQWCSNCHALAPTWDAIATHLKAGTRSSNLIVALFDCEKSQQHMQLCMLAGMTHYPTLMFIGAGTYHDTDFLSRSILGQRSAGPAGIAPIPHTVKFQGNWQYGDALLDWIRLMQGLSRWHRWTSGNGILRVLRNGLLGFLRPSSTLNRRSSSQVLPIGIPGTGTSSLSAAAQAQVNHLTHELQVVQEESELLTKATTHASLLLDNLLFPPKQNSTHTDNTTDMFTLLDQTPEGWTATSSKDPIIFAQRTCVLELIIDFCNRITAHTTSDYLDEALDNTNDTSSLQFPNFLELEQMLQERVQQREPYCVMMEECLQTDFEKDECRPATCPFKGPMGCRYLSACLDDTLLIEYGVALGLMEEGEPFPKPTSTAKSSSSSKKGDSDKQQSKKKGGWGIQLGL